MQATAHISYVYNFTPLIVEYDNLKSQRPNVAFSSYRYIDYSQNRSVITDSIIKRFPVVMRGDGTPWDLANLYLIHRFNVISQSDIASMLTIRNNANSLLDYLKFIESMKNKNPKYDEFYFPEDARMRILNLYRIFLKKRHERVSGLDGIEISTAKGLLNNIINFYRTIISNGLIEPGKIKNLPFVESTVNVRMVGHNGQVYTKTTKTTDLSIRGKTHPLPSNLIKDQGNRVRPMSNQDERLMIEKLFEIGSRKYQLFILFALYTGARIQTIGTLRIKNIKQALKNSTLNSPEIDMKVGPGTTIDTKGDARYRLKIPRPLVNDLINYVNSSYAKDIRTKSFYGDTDENYVFLTDGRSPSAYYTSKKEMVDRTNSIYSRRLTAKDRLDFQPSLGGTIRQFINKLNRHCLAEDSDFQEFHCHDLRATYGMNFIDAAYESGRMNGSQILNALRERMGHTDINTTMRYLDYREKNEQHLEYSNKVAITTYGYWDEV